MGEFSLFPEQAATNAPAIDSLYFALLGISLFFAGLIAMLLLIFAVRYRRSANVNRTITKHGFLKLELAWTAIPFVISMGIFGWASKVYFDNRTPPEGAMEMYVVGHQWMWKIQHPEGVQEINELHVPVGRPIKLTMSTQDVIHSFFIPAFRVKMDVLPGRYTTLWFEATKTGEYHLFCAEYCGTLHSGMIGKVYVMEPQEYARWLGGAGTGTSMVSAGEGLFSQFGCANCHITGEGVDAPSLKGLWGSRVKLQGGETVLADANHIRESILNPQKRVVPGFTRMMPTFEGQVNQDQLAQLLEYIKSLTPADAAGAAGGPSAGASSPAGEGSTRSQE